MSVRLTNILATPTQHVTIWREVILVHVIQDSLALHVLTLMNVSRKTNVILKRSVRTRMEVSPANARQAIQAMA